MQIAQLADMSAKSNFHRLEIYIRDQMRMSHVYQPVLLRVLLERGGAATTEDIAKALLSYDRSQVEYYEIRTKNMVGKVLTQNGVIEPVKDGRRIVGYRLAASDLSEQEIAALIELCQQRLSAYIGLRGDGIWGHRGIADGYVPGSVRYEVLKRAKHRCELCGAHEEQAALHVDHIVPRAKGGSDDLSNFQALCVTCNTNKRDRDDTDFRDVQASYGIKDQACIFCTIGEDRIIADSVEKQRVAGAESDAPNRTRAPFLSGFARLLRCGKDLCQFAEVLSGCCEEEFVICAAWAA